MEGVPHWNLEMPSAGSYCCSKANAALCPNQPLKGFTAAACKPSISHEWTPLMRMQAH